MRNGTLGRSWTSSGGWGKRSATKLSTATQWHFAPLCWSNMLNPEYRADRRERQDVEFRFPDARCARATLLDIEPYTRQLVEILEEVSARAAAPPPTGFAYTPPPLHADKRDARQEKQRLRALVPATWRELYDLYDAFWRVHEDWGKRIDQALSRVEMAEHEIDDWDLPRKKRLSCRITRALKDLRGVLPPPASIPWDSSCLPPGCSAVLTRRNADLSTLIAELDAAAEEVGTPEPDEPLAATPMTCAWTYPAERAPASEADRIELRGIRERVKSLLAITGVRSAFESGIERFDEIAREATADVARVELAHWNRAKTVLKDGRYRYRNGELQEDCPELRRECTWVTVRGWFNPETFCDERCSELARDVHAAMNAGDGVGRAPSARGAQQGLPPPCQKVELTEVRIAIRPLKIPPPRAHPIRAKWRDLQEYPDLDRVAVAYACLGALHDSQSLMAPIMDTAIAYGIRPMEDLDLIAKLHWRTLMPVQGEDKCQVPLLDPAVLTPDMARELLALVENDLISRALVPCPVQAACLRVRSSEEEQACLPRARHQGNESDVATGFPSRGIMKEGANQSPLAVSQWGRGPTFKRDGQLWHVEAIRKPRNL